MKRLITAAVGAATVAGLSACKAGLDANFFLSDVAAVARDGTPLDTTLTLSIDAVSDEKCASSKDIIGGALGGGFTSVTFIECRKGDMTTHADYRITVPMVRAEAKTDTALAFWASDVGSGQIGVVMKPDLARIDKIVAALPNDVRTALSGQLEPVISLTIQNDLAGPANISMQGAFIDGQPYQLVKTSEVARRGELRIVLSDVGNAAFYNGGSLMFFMDKP